MSGEKAEKVVRRLGFTNWIRVESTGYAGGIWLLWNDEYANVHYCSSTTQLLHCKVEPINEGASFWMTGVYGEPNLYHRNELWEDLVGLSRNIDEPWIVAGYFNAYRQAEDKSGGAPPKKLSMKNFNSCIERARAQLLEVEAVGERFTWEKGEVKERLDWAFCNIQWRLAFPCGRVNHLYRFGSDHRPLHIVSSPPRDHTQRKKLFRCQAEAVLLKGFFPCTRA